jgi:spore coat protein A, manganese oxidase
VAAGGTPGAGPAGPPIPLADSHNTKPEPDASRFGRRAFLTAAATGAVALALPVRPRLSGIGLSASQAATPQPFKGRLPIPDVLRSRQIAIDMREAEVQILPGRPTRMWTYNGTFPGPTIRRPAAIPGSPPTEVTFTHSLPASTGELTVHLHGGHNRAEHDGQPGGLTQTQPQALYCDVSRGLSPEESGNDLLIAPGAQRTYVYDLTEDGAPERASFQWYHDHRLERTAPNVWRGLAGMWIIDDEVDGALPLPRGERDIPLMIADRGFTRQNQLTNPFSGFGHPPNDGITAKYVLVNGAYRPHHRVTARRHRLRVLNASNFRAYNLALSNGAPLVQIATESGLMPKPVERKRVLVGPGERVELIVDFGRFPHRNVELLSVPRRDGEDGLGSKAYIGTLMQFRVGRRRPDSTRVPRRLRPLPEWVADAQRQPQKTWRLAIDGFRWVINGHTYDPAYVEHSPAIDTTETWSFQNRTSVGHLVHLHHTDWYMLSRNGRRPRPWERALKETFFLDPRDEVVVAGHFSDHLGKFVVHCHMLDHEDHGLMSQFEVIDPTTPPPPG